MEIDPKSRTAKLYLIAQKIAERIPDFFDIKVQGKGNDATNMYMNLVNNTAQKILGEDLSNKAICDRTDSCFDFYVPEDKTVLEIALSLRNPNTEYEKDIFKCIIARDAGLPIERLILLSKPGALIKHAEPYRQAVAEVTRLHFGIEVVVLELQRAESVGTSE